MHGSGEMIRHVYWVIDMEVFLVGRCCSFEIANGTGKVASSGALQVSLVSCKPAPPSCTAVAF